MVEYLVDSSQCIINHRHDLQMFPSCVFAAENACNALQNVQTTATTHTTQQQLLLLHVLLPVVEIIVFI